MGTNQQVIDDQVKVEVERFFKVFEQSAEARLQQLENELRAAHLRDRAQQGAPSTSQSSTASTGGTGDGAGATGGAGTSQATAPTTGAKTAPANTAADYAAAAAQAGLSLWAAPGVMRGWGQVIPFIPAATALLDTVPGSEASRTNALTSQRFVLPAVIGGGLLLLARSVR